MMIIQENNRQNKSIVHTKDYFTFIGFCFENNASKPKEIDVYINNEKITSILSNISNPQLEAIYDIEQSNVCFEYDLPSEYIKEENIIRFKCHDTQEELTNSPIDFSKIKDFNEIAFMHSLKQPVDNDIKDMYCPNTIGFLATKENLEDEEFVGYIKKLICKYPEINYSFFYLDKSVVELFFNKLESNTGSTCLVKSVFDLNSSIIILNNNSNIDLKINNSLLINFKILYFNNSKNKTIVEWEKQYSNYFNTLKIKNNIKEEVSVLIYMNNKTNLFTNKLSNQSNFYQYYYFTFIYQLFKDEDFRNFVVKFYRIENER